jgi:quinol monooxygenase YgiN
MPEIAADAACATFVNTFRCAPEHQDEVVRINIEIVERVAAASAGFISASVHRSVDGTRVINYLQWRSAEHLTAMQRSPQFQQVARQLAGLIEFDPHECRVVHVRQA